MLKKTNIKKLNSVSENSNILTYTGYLILILISFFLIFSFFQEKTIYIEAGPRGGFFDTSANVLKKRLKEYNINAEVINREDTIKIVEDINDVKKNIHIGFVAQDLKNVHFKNVEAIGSLILEPLFIFYRKDLELNSLADFKGLKIGIGPENSGTRLLAETILNIYGVNDKNTIFVDKTHSIHFDMMEKGKLDVGFFLLPANNQFVFKLGTNPNLKIFSLKNSKAISRKFDYLYPEVVQAGGFDLRNNIPKNDIQVVSLPVDLVAKKNLDPSVVVAISLILKEEFKDPNIISDASTFPSMKYIKNLEVNKRAKEIIEMPFGSLPFLYKYLPFKFAALIDKFGVNLSYIFTIIIIFRYMGFPYPFRFYQMIMNHIYYKRAVKIREKSLKNKLSMQDIKMLNKVENYFNKDLVGTFVLTKKESLAENKVALDIVKEIKKKI